MDKKLIVPLLLAGLILLVIGFMFGSSGQKFGSGTSTTNIGGNLTVGGTATFAGASFSSVTSTSVTTTNISTSNLTATGTLTLTGTTTTISGQIVGVPNTLTVSMMSATNTPCAVQNTSGVTHTLLSASAIYTATNSVGSTGVFQAGTSTGPTVTSTNPFISTIISKSASLDVITPTSTFSSTSTNNPTYPLNYLTWRNTEWITFNAGSTSVHAGTCYVTYNW